jgi:hypothetical protein
MCLVERGLLHDAQELVLVDLAVAWWGWGVRVRVRVR